jgi:hypothetical protein
LYRSFQKKIRSACVSTLLLIASFALIAAEEPKPILPAESAKPAPVTTGPAKREPYSDAIAGYSVLLPTGYRPLTENETRKVFKWMSEGLARDVGDRAGKRPPVWFIGSTDPKKPDELPPSFAIGFAELDQQIDPALIPAYKLELEEKHKREGDKVGGVALSIVTVDGITSLQEEYAYSMPNNGDGRLIRLAVPGKGKWYEMYFSYSPSQDESVHAALKEVLDSFKVMEHPPENIENHNKWMRVLYYTLGFGLAGVVLSFLWRRLSGEK